MIYVLGLYYNVLLYIYICSTLFLYASIIFTLQFLNFSISRSIHKHASECNDLRAVKNIFIGRRIVGLFLLSLLRACEHFAVLDKAKLYTL